MAEGALAPCHDLGVPLVRSSHERLILPAVALACLGCLQPGIDPVFLTLLSSAHGFSPVLHGWVVTATQTGMAIGSVVAWRFGARFPTWLLPATALTAVFASVTTAFTSLFGLLLLVRFTYGLSMGLIYTQAMSNAASNRPHGAYGAVFLCQLILATLIALLLPAIADSFSPNIALASLALAPASALVLICLSKAWSGRSESRDEVALPAQGHGAPMHAWATAWATLLFICATMMVWTFSGALAVDAGIDEDVIGRAVALGSLAGAITAFFVMREQPVMPPALTGILAGLSLLTPIVATRSGTDFHFILSIVALNIGSTAIIVRASGLASGASLNGFFRRFVTCTHSLGMILGPITGSFATMMFGNIGLLSAAILAIASGCLLLAVGQYGKAGNKQKLNLRDRLDEILTTVLSSNHSIGNHRNS